jgi:hypothetical protein
MSPYVRMHVFCLYVLQSQELWLQNFPWLPPVSSSPSLTKAWIFFGGVGCSL